MRATHQRLYVNVDHIATVRQARRTVEPDPVALALVCERAGADGITAHLREDRRHIQDDDVRRLRNEIRTVLNLEMACTAEMVDFAEQIGPYQITLVPEKREEITTEGGLDLSVHPAVIAESLRRLAEAGIRTSLFIDPTLEQVRRARDLGAHAIELHTGQYAQHAGSDFVIQDLEQAATEASDIGLNVHAGHGLTVRNVGPVSAIPEIEELNIGHSIVSRALLLGIGAAVAEIRAAMNAARRDQGSGIRD